MPAVKNAEIAPSCADVTEDPVQTEQPEVDSSENNSTELE